MLKLWYLTLSQAVLKSRSVHAYIKGERVTDIICGVTLSVTIVKHDQETEEVFVQGTIEGLEPGKHGLYVCSLGNITNGYMSSGVHYNPCEKRHGGPEDADRHVGDLGNVEANDDGVAKFEMHDRLLRLAGNYSIIGRTLVVTENEDDLGKGENDESAATGNAGKGLAWGIIGIANK
ncbi:superoxide dismutase [Cu-Zn]-like isoform X2 [Rhincodon typus]|uniref:superoxide dismutase [Cu-Zn]-like isoform X2 n=1 Tax=Rhincodon typus TaxID=259920 RepID=UPI00202E3B5E|nr:superoxide dismutase [Cu-Zn]-like isoform X2 [Rhincodon typus]